MNAMRKPNDKKRLRYQERLEFRIRYRVLLNRHKRELESIGSPPRGCVVPPAESGTS